MKFISCLILLFILSACSRSDIMIRFFDEIAISKTDDYFDLTSKQREELRKDLQKDITNARKDLLPQIAKILRSLEPEVDKEKLDADLVAKQVLEFQTYFKKLSSYFADTAVKTAASFEPSQIHHFAKEVREEIKDKSEEDVRSEVHKRYRKSVEFWIGGMSAEQKEKLTKFLKATPYPHKLQNQNKEYVLSQFLEAHKNPDVLKKFVRDFCTDYEIVRLPAYTEALNAHKKAFQKFLVEEFWPTVSKTQKTTFKENLKSRAAEFEKIAQRP